MEAAQEFSVATGLRSAPAGRSAIARRFMKENSVACRSKRPRSCAGR
jgi:hypothetical protein